MKSIATYVNPTAMTCVTPSHVGEKYLDIPLKISIKAGDVIVASSEVQTIKTTFTFHVEPIVTRAIPTTGSSAGGQSVSILVSLCGNMLQVLCGAALDLPL